MCRLSESWAAISLSVAPVTIGQYLQPTSHQLEVVDHVHPVVFAWYREVGRALGFQVTASGPLVRSSYHAEEVWLEKAEVR